MVDEPCVLDPGNGSLAHGNEVRAHVSHQDVWRENVALVESSADQLNRAYATGLDHANHPELAQDVTARASIDVAVDADFISIIDGETAAF